MTSRLPDTKNPGWQAGGKQTVESGSTTPPRVFIVEDHPALRESLVELVRREKNLTFCGEAGEAQEAFEAIARLKPDLVLVDISLPDKDGLELVADLRATDREMKLLVHSMHDVVVYGDRALAAGANGYVRKEGKPQVLMRAILAVLAGHCYMSKDTR